MQKRLTVSIIILTKNQKKFLERSLPAIFSQTFKDFEVIVGDSGSTDGVLELIKKYPVRLIHVDQTDPKTYNFAKAFNGLARRAKGKYLIRLSGDAVPANNAWLGNLIKGLADTKVAGAYSRYLFSIFADLCYQIWFRPIFRFLKGGEETSFAGASCVLKKERWKEYSLNEDWGQGEDWEWGEVMKAKGYKILFNKNSLVFHEHRSSLPKQITDLFCWLLIGLPKGVRRLKELEKGIFSPLSPEAINNCDHREPEEEQGS